MVRNGREGNTVGMGRGLKCRDGKEWKRRDLKALDGKGWKGRL